MSMQENCLIINGVPTKVLTWGKGIGDEFEENEKLVLFVPGNPGITLFYIEFLEELHKVCGHSVWIVGHAGHERIAAHHMPPRQNNEHLYNLEGQIDHKGCFIQNYVPKQAKLFMMGHSIGAYIILNLLKIPSTRIRVLNNYLLFPTIEFMAESLNGVAIMRFLRYFQFLLLIFVFFFDHLPNFLKVFLVSIYCRVASIPMVYCEVIKDFLNPYTIGNFAFMGMDELHTVRQRDNQILQENLKTVKLYYGEKDNWVPLSYYAKIIDDIPGIDAEVCDRGYNHAFIFRSSVPMAHLIANWIKS